MGLFRIITVHRVTLLNLISSAVLRRPRFTDIVVLVLMEGLG